MYYIINTTNQTQECKMFISVADTRDPITVYNALSPFRKGIREFLPQHFFNILSHTNHHVSIKEALFLVDELPQDKHINFKDAIISAIEHRETTEFNKNKMITFANKLSFEQLILKLIEHKYSGNTALAITEFMKYAVCDKKTAEQVIGVL